MKYRTAIHLPPEICRRFAPTDLFIIFSLKDQASGATYPVPLAHLGGTLNRDGLPQL